MKTFKREFDTQVVRGALAMGVSPEAIAGVLGRHVKELESTLTRGIMLSGSEQIELERLTGKGAGTLALEGTIASCPPGELADESLIAATRELLAELDDATDGARVAPLRAPTGTHQPA